MSKNRGLRLEQVRSLFQIWSPGGVTFAEAATSFSRRQQSRAVSGRCLPWACPSHGRSVATGMGEVYPLLITRDWTSRARRSVGPFGRPSMCRTRKLTLGGLQSISGADRPQRLLNTTLLPFKWRALPRQSRGWWRRSGTVRANAARPRHGPHPHVDRFRRAGDDQQ